ncbi:MAG TPA: IS481 family transposase [Acidimicrobiia bacterium]|jgi:transposase InsO family protein/transposase-like protein
MAKTVTVETRLRAVLAADVGVSVTELCRRLEISRDTFYRYRRRFEAEGPLGLGARSRRPLSSPGQTPTVIEDRIVWWRKHLQQLGVDHGAQTIFYHLRREGAVPLPGVATIHRVLVRRGLVIPRPQNRPRGAHIRFEWPRPNDAWQIDATAWALASGKGVWVMDLIDDHSRLVPAALACSGPTGAAAWEALSLAAARYGLPAHVLSDNGICFTGRFLNPGGESNFERQLRQLGIGHIRSTPGHPQTCGKLERFHWTLKQWLAARPLMSSLPELQVQLDAFLDYYNHIRPHDALAGDTPARRWRASPPAGPGAPLAAQPRTSLHRVDQSGSCSWRTFSIGVGQDYRGHMVLIVARGEELSVFGSDGLIRTLTIDPTRRNQPSGKARGRRPRPKP